MSKLLTVSVNDLRKYLGRFEVQCTIVAACGRLSLELVAWCYEEGTIEALQN